MISYAREKVDTLKTCNCIVEMLVKPVGVKALIEVVQQSLD